MPNEIEAKFKVDSHRPIRRSLRRAGAVYLNTCIQTDRYFDTTKKELLGRDSGLRIRSVHRLKAGRGEFDSVPEITFKGPRKHQKGMKIRSEYQTRIEDADAIVQIFRAMGLKVSMTVQKRRAEYRLGRAVIALDTLPLLGDFVEIEAPGEKEVGDVCKRLSLNGEMITVPYTQLLAEHCKKANINRNKFLLD